MPFAYPGEVQSYGRSVRTIVEHVFVHPVEVVEEALRLCDQGLSARAVGLHLGVPDRTVRMWRAGSVPKRAGRCEPPAFDSLPPEDYAYLFGLYLGDGWIAAVGARRFSLRISCDQRYPELIAAAARAMASVNPGKRIRIWRRAKSDAVVASYWVHWPTVFPQHGPGPKHARPIVMEEWQQRITTRHPDAFIRGLIHSDGCRYRAVVRSRGREYVYARYGFSNKSEDIKGLFCTHLDQLGIHWTRPNDQQIAIATRAGVAALDAFVGPKS
jgi:hypothetical protein